MSPEDEQAFYFRLFSFWYFTEFATMHKYSISFANAPISSLWGFLKSLTIIQTIMHEEGNLGLGHPGHPSHNSEYKKVIHATPIHVAKAANAKRPNGSDL